MKKGLWIALATTTLLAACGTNQNTVPSGSSVLNNEIDSMNYALGINIGQMLDAKGVESNYAAMIQGIEDGALDSLPMDKAVVGQLLQNMQNYDMVVAGRTAKTIGEAFLVENATKEGVITTESGLQYKVLQEGNDEKPDANDRVTAHYTGMLLDGTVFDSSVEKGRPLVREANRVISGWTEGLQLMGKGAKYKFYIPYAMAYGVAGNPQAKIPGYSVLIFDIELLDFESID